MTTRLRLATRGSPLAQAQSLLAVAALRVADPTLEVDLVTVRTEGDADRTTPLHTLGGRGVFVRAVEAALLAGEADFAEHSLKDVPTDPVAGLTLAALLPRGDPRDALVASGGRRLAELPAGARVGTGSPRRRLLLQALRSSLVPIGVHLSRILRHVALSEAGQRDGFPCPCAPNAHPTPICTHRQCTARAATLHPRWRRPRLTAGPRVNLQLATYDLYL